MIVDTHAHIFSATGPFKEGARYTPAYDAALEQWFSLWTQAQVTHGVLVQPSFLGVDNSFMLQALRQHPHVLRAVVVIDSSVDRTTLSDWDAAGVRGVRLNLIGITDLLSFVSASWRQIFTWMADLGWHLEVQCEGERLPQLLSLLGDVPLPLVIDHFGLPDPGAAGICNGTRALLRESGKREILVKLSAPYRLRGADANAYAALFVNELGPQNLLWGSDWPWTNHESGRTYTACIKSISDWAPDEAMRHIILEETPRRLYRF